MPRKPRIEYEGAVYHVLNRGNYQEDLFDVDGSGPMFEEVLFAAAGRFGWVLHAYVIMSTTYVELNINSDSSSGNINPNTHHSDAGCQPALPDPFASPGVLGNLKQHDRGGWDVD